MNLRIENKNLRFKITEEELKILLSEHPIHTKVSILDKTFIVAINLQKRADVMEARLVQDGGETYLNLLVPLNKLQELFDIGRNRKGIEVKIDDLTVSLQVDVRADSRKVQKENK